LEALWNECTTTYFRMILEILLLLFFEPAIRSPSCETFNRFPGILTFPSGRLSLYLFFFFWVFFSGLLLVVGHFSILRLCSRPRFQTRARLPLWFFDPFIWHLISPLLSVSPFFFGGSVESCLCASFLLRPVHIAACFFPFSFFPSPLFFSRVLRQDGSWSFRGRRWPPFSIGIKHGVLLCLFWSFLRPLSFSRNFAIACDLRRSYFLFSSVRFRRSGTFLPILFRSPHKIFFIIEEPSLFFPPFLRRYFFFFVRFVFFLPCRLIVSELGHFFFVESFYLGRSRPVKFHHHSPGIPRARVEERSPRRSLVYLLASQR